MPIYEGNHPPNVEGCYWVSPVQLLYASDGCDAEFYDMLFSVGSPDGMGRTPYRERQHHVSGDGTPACIVGHADCFTLYTLEQVDMAEGEVTYQTMTIVSGRKRAEGIVDYRLALIMVEKSADHGLLADQQVVRIFADGDGIARETEERP